MTFARIPVRAVRCRDLTASAFRVLIAIAAHADRDGRAFPSLARIADLVEIPRHKIPALIKSLERAAVLQARRQRDDRGRHSVTVYSIVLDQRGDEGWSPTAEQSVPLQGGRGVPPQGTLTDHTTDHLTDRSNTQRTALPRNSIRGSCKTSRLAEPIDAEFESFWAEVPRKVARAAALRAFRAARRKVDAATIIGGIQRYKVETAGRELKFVKHPSTWLTGECWNDEPTAAAPQQSRSGKRTIMDALRDMVARENP